MLTTQPLSDTQPATLHARPKVLVVDSDEQARTVLEVSLRREGFDVTALGTRPSDGVAAFQALVLSGTHEALLLQLAALEGEPRLGPVIVMCATDDAQFDALARHALVRHAIKKPVFAKDIAALLTVELAGASSAPVALTVEVMSAAHVLRALVSANASGRLTLARGRGSVAFRNGQVMDARFGQAWGVDALVRALCLTRDSYDVRLEPMSVSAELHCSLRELVQVVLPRVSKWEAALATSVSLDARLRVDFEKLAGAVATLPNDVSRIVQLFDGRRTVFDVVLDSAFEPLITLEVANRLGALKIITPVPLEEPPMPDDVPALFEPKPTTEQQLGALFADLTNSPAPIVDSAPMTAAQWAGKASGLALAEAESDGGWTAGKPSEALGDAMEAEVAGRLDALSGSEPKAETPTAPAPQKPEPVKAIPASAAPEVFVTPKGFDLERSITPVVVMAVTPEELVPEHHPIEPQPAVAAPAAVPTVDAPPPASAPVASAEPDAVGLDHDFFNAAPVEAEAKSLPNPTPVSATTQLPWLLGGLAAAALISALGFEMLRSKDEGPAPMPPPVVAAAPVVAPAPTPAPVAEVPPAVVEEAKPVAPVVEMPEEPVAAAMVMEEEPVVPSAPVVEAPADEIAADLEKARKQYEAARYRDAVKALEAIVAKAPKSTLGWLFLGLARYDAGNANGARAAAERVLALDPNNARVQMLLVSLEYDANQPAKARAALERYLQLEPKGQFAAEARALLKR